MKRDHNPSMRTISAVFFSLFLLFATGARAQELEPFINFLRSAPAYMSGEVAFRSESVLYQEGWTIVKILANQKIGFTFKENYLEVRPQNGFYVKYAGFRVLIESVTWTPSGMKTVSKVPADITGLSRGTVSRGVADVLEDIFGEQLLKANNLLKRVRRQQSMGQIFEIAKAVVYVFTRSDSAGNVSLPNYYGEMGLSFLPGTRKAFNLYGMRVGIRDNDHFRASFKFTGDNKGIYPYSAALVSARGTDINQGREFVALKRMVLETVTLDSQGIDLKLHLGASEVAAIFLSGLEAAARARGESTSCPRCEETATFPALRIRVEGYVRQAIMEQVNALWKYLPGFNISQRTLSSFKRHEACRTRNLTCLSNCSRDNNNADEAMACKRRCDQTRVSCLKN